MTRRPNVMAVLMLVTVSGCGGSESPPAVTPERTPVMYVVNYPLEYFAERIGGDEVDVRFPAPDDEDPAFWQPEADDIAAYQTADLIILNGATYATWVDMVSLPDSKLIDTSASFRDRHIRIEESATHSHSLTGVNSQAGTASTTWLDFEQAIAQARAIHDALARLRPAKAETFGTNLASLEADLRSLDEQMSALALEIGDQPLVASHPVYQYWARRYGLNVRAVTWEPDVVPDDRALGDLKAILANHPATIMIWPGDADPRSVTLLRELGLESVVFNPCGNTPEQGDFLSVMRQNIGGIKRIASGF